MGDGYVVSPTDLLQASQSMDSAVDQLREASDQLTKAELPATALGTEKTLAAITSAWNKAVDARRTDVKKCAEILDAMIDAMGETIKEYHENETETAKHFQESTEAGLKDMEESGKSYDPMKPPKLDGNGDSSGDGGAGAVEGDSGAGSGDTGGSADGSGTTDGGDGGGATENGGVEAGVGAGPGGGACGEHPVFE